jgi:hypothetical protein
MAEITEATSIEELAVIISEALEAAGITATLSGGGAVSIYSHNQYMSHDLDFVTSADPKSLLQAIAPWASFRGQPSGSMNNPRTTWLVEFPAGPLAFRQAVIVCRSHSIDWDAMVSWAENERPEFEEVQRLRAEADSHA